jgi:hypothetical protein
MRLYNHLNEGTWSAPRTVEKAKKLKELFDNMLVFPSAKKDLWNIIGNDDFYDEMNQKFGKKPWEDMRFFIARWIYSNWLKDINWETGNTNNNIWKESWDKKALYIVWNTIKEFL